ncbi:hypothetical protein L0128_14870 [candidate division KSB1 bacterium]|nr:hypothetical protein [candidate division KSB1 bacterium]
MRRLRWPMIFFFLTTLLLFQPQPTRAVEMDSSCQKIIRFQQIYLDYQWKLVFRHHWLISPRFELAVNQTFLSSLLDLSRLGKKWNDTQSLVISSKFKLSSKLALRTTGSSMMFVDRQTGFSNDRNTHAVTSGLQYQSPPSASGASVLLAAGTGIKFDRRFAFQDIGQSYTGEIRLLEQEFQHYYNQFTFQWYSDQMPARQNQDLTFFYRIHREFYQETSDTLTLAFDRKRRDYYLSPQGEIESLQESASFFQNNLHYLIVPGFKLNFITQLKSRKVNLQQLRIEKKEAEDARERTDFRADNELKLDFSRQHFRNIFRLKYWSQEQVYQSPGIARSYPSSFRVSFVAPDNTSYLLGIENFTGWRFQPRDSLAFGTSLSRLQYDTPDTSNFDDRDEFRLDFRLSEYHFFSSRLWMQVDVIASLYHLAYIFGERSADNNWNRIFRIVPKIFFTINSNAFCQQSFEVLANYVDYDFEAMQGDVKSFVYRKFAGENLLEYRLSSRLKLNTSCRLELEENGKLYWQKWLERPLLNRRNIWIRAMLSYHCGASVRIAPGFNLFNRVEWKHIFTREGAYRREKFNQLTNQGPLLNVTYTPHSQLTLMGTLTRNKIQNTQKKKYFINHIDFELNWNF